MNLNGWFWRDFLETVWWTFQVILPVSFHSKNVLLTLSVNLPVSFVFPGNRLRISNGTKTLPTSQDPLPSQSNPPPLSSDLPSSPLPFDSVDNLFNQDAIEMSDSDVPIQWRHSTRNPRIGSGFNNNPDDPVQIVDEEDDVDVDGEDEGDVPGVVTAEVLTRPLSSFHDSRIVLESVCTRDTLAQLRRDY